MLSKAKAREGCGYAVLFLCDPLSSLQSDYCTGGHLESGVTRATKVSPLFTEQMEIWDKGWLVTKVPLDGPDV